MATSAFIPINDSVKTRFAAKVRVAGDGECWEWTAGVGVGGYGSIAINGSPYRAHRVSYALHHAQPGSLLVCHTCDNRRCVNPSHLFLGTSSDNVRDMVAKGRNVRAPRDETSVNYVRGEKSNFAKLREKDVLEIRRRYEAGDPPTQICKEYGVDRTLVWQIAKRRVWAHV